MQDKFTRPAARVAIIYLVVSSLWILLSDRWLGSVIGGTPELYTAQTIKGWLFVLCTSGLLYLLMKQTLHRIRDVAFEDPISGLPNRLAFTSELQNRCKLSAASQHSFSLTILDVDHFADLNDERGHSQGDMLLSRLGKQLARHLDDSWYVARLGGDEFGLLSPLGTDPASTVTELDRLRRSVTQSSKDPLLIDQTVSAGTSQFPNHGTSSHDLMRNADMALLFAKKHGRDQHKVYRDQLQHDLLERLSLLKELKAACDNRAFSVVYQPQWSVAKQAWSGAEVLIRWHHPERGAIPPDVFIPLAEREGLITPITEFVVQQSLSELRAAGICRDSLPYLSINLSHPVLLNTGTMDKLFTLIQDQGEECPQIMMELTETAAMVDLDATMAAVQRWRGQGIEFSIDDFGTGYSSLARLKQMPITELKIDRSFVKDIPGNQNDAVITRAILAMAQTLSLNVVAEGVETQEQCKFLTEHGCTSLQGYFLARPMPIAALQELLSQ